MILLLSLLLVFSILSSHPSYSLSLIYFLSSSFLSFSISVPLSKHPSLLQGTDRSIVSDVAGTTRDSVDALVVRGDMNYRIIDTAGIRKKGKVEYGAEFFMINRAFKAVKRAEVVVLLLDALDGIVEQDRILAQRIAEEGRSCVIALNKWDIVPDKDDKTYIKAVENIRSNVPVLRWAEVVLISALTGTLQL